MAEASGSNLELAQAGDARAFAGIVASYHEDLARIAYFVSGDLDIAEEAEQSAWGIAYRRLGDLREAERLRPWLMSIAANEARQLVRSRGRRTVREIAVGRSSVPDEIDHAAVLDLGAALSKLEPKDRQLLGLRFVGGLESREIADVMGISPGAVRVRLHRLLDRLRKDLRDG